MIDYSASSYAKVVYAKSHNERVISNLYAKLPSLTQEDKIIVLKNIDNLRRYNLEYDKYIINYHELEKPLQKTTYTVKEGDTLISIATKLFGDHRKWTEIYLFNKMTDILLTVGDVLDVPDA